MMGSAVGATLLVSIIVGIVFIVLRGLVMIQRNTNMVRAREICFCRDWIVIFFLIRPTGMTSDQNDSHIVLVWLISFLIRLLQNDQRACPFHLFLVAFETFL